MLCRVADGEGDAFGDLYDRFSGDPLAAKAKQDLLDAALDQLPELQRKAIELAFLKGYTQVEIAEIFEEPLGTIKARIRRGMIQMRGMQDGALNPDDSGREESS